MMFNVACIYSLASGQVRTDPLGAEGQDLEAEYRAEAAARIRSALELLPPEQRSGFWQTKMRADPALDPIRASAEFAQLERDYAPPQNRTATRER
jgi:hypothetical protein